MSNEYLVMRKKISVLKSQYSVLNTQYFILYTPKDDTTGNRVYIHNRDWHTRNLFFCHRDRKNDQNYYGELHSQ